MTIIEGKEDDTGRMYRKVELIQVPFDILETALLQSIEYIKSEMEDLIYRRNPVAHAKVIYHFDWDRGFENLPVYLGSIEFRKTHADITEVVVQRMVTGNLADYFETIVSNWRGLVKLDKAVTSEVKTREKKINPTGDTELPVNTRRYSPKRNADYGKWKIYWFKIKPYVGWSVKKIADKVNLDPKFINVTKYKVDTIRKIIKAGNAGEFGDEPS